MRRYLRLLGVQLRASLQLSMQYRADFLVGCGMALFDLFWNITPMVVVFTHRTQVAGWTFPEALFVIAWFTFLRGLFEGALTPSLVAAVEHIRKGTLDFMLMKPADAPSTSWSPGDWLATPPISYICGRPRCRSASRSCLHWPAAPSSTRSLS
jgi:ABC-type uncharacterized transport system permease subunit